MRLDPSQTPMTASTDASGMPQLPRGQLAYARPAPAFLRAMNLAQQMQPGGVWMPAQQTPAAPAAGNLSQNVAYGRNASGTLTSSALAPEASVARWSATVKSGQTLSGIVRDQMAARGANISTSDAMRLAQTVARANNLSNPDLIHPGQQINLESLNLSLSQNLASKQSVTAAAQLAQRQALQQPTTAGNAGSQRLTATAAQLQMLSNSDRSGSPVLDKTLDRAVEKGFIPASERQAVYNKIMQLSVQHRFSADDFARLTLMESDGMNPKASNSRCHGIIQFCDGPDRGAASAGFGNNPRAILGHSVLQQLDLVDKYFEDTGLRSYGPVGLDDLYLTVLTPAARNETRPNAALNIPGPQAAYLHVNRDTSAPITRNSILAGLHYNANERLRSATDVAQRNATPVAASATRAQLARANAPTAQSATVMTATTLQTEQTTPATQAVQLAAASTSPAALASAINADAADLTAYVTQVADESQSLR